MKLIFRVNFLYTLHECFSKETISRLSMFPRRNAARITNNTPIDKIWCLAEQQAHLHTTARGNPIKMKKKRQENYMFSNRHREEGKCTMFAFSFSLKPRQHHVLANKHYGTANTNIAHITLSRLITKKMLFSTKKIYDFN
jgi:hypothetical protein